MAFASSLPSAPLIPSMDAGSAALGRSPLRLTIDGGATLRRPNLARLAQSRRIRPPICCSLFQAPSFCPSDKEISPMSRPRVVIFSGNIRRPSRSRALAEALGAEIGRRLPVELKSYDVLDAGPGLGSALAR